MVLVAVLGVLGFLVGFGGLGSHFGGFGGFGKVLGSPRRSRRTVPQFLGGFEVILERFCGGFWAVLG